MKKIDMLNLIGGIVILSFGISYFFREEYLKSGIEIIVGIFLIAPVLFKRGK